MAIEIKEKEGETSVGGAILLIASFLILLIVIGGFAYLQFSALSKNEKRISELNNTLIAQRSEETKQVETQAQAIENFVNDFKILFTNRSKLLAFFDAFETWAHPRISYANLSLNAETYTATMTGTTTDFKPVIQQMSILKRQPLITNFEVSDAKASGEEGVVTFNLSLILSPELFK